MDSIAHGLWAAAIGQAAQTRIKWWVWGLIGAGPDFVWLPFTAINFLSSGHLHYFNGPYNVSHSLVVWALASLAVFLFWRRIFLYTWPWALHIIIDIPGHQDMLTPIFWPLWTKKFYGLFDWLSFPVIIGTYIALIFTFAIIFFLRRRKIRWN